MYLNHHLITIVEYTYRQTQGGRAACEYFPGSFHLCPQCISVLDCSGVPSIGQPCIQP